MRGQREATRSRLSRCKTGLYFHYAFGFSKTLPLAYMLHSLVRVSRRVEKIADLIATDLLYHSGAHLNRDAHRSRTALYTVQPSRTAYGEQGPVLRKRVRPFLDPPTDDAITGYNSPAEAGGTFRRSL